MTPRSVLDHVPSGFSLLVWAAIWELIGRFGGIDLIPPMSAIVAKAVELVQTDAFMKALAVTAQAFGVGMALAIVVGIPLGVLMGVWRPAERLLDVWVNIFISAPLTALVPALMPLLGIGQTTVVATVFLFAVWVLVIDTQAGIRHVGGSLVDMARVFGGTRSQIFFKVLLPGALPEILTGLRLAVVRGVKGVVIGQIIIALLGFGELFELYLQNFLMEEFWALVFVVFALAFVLVELVGMVERRFDFYAGSR
ncbi:ABC transporter permease [Rhodoplanes azumiensis]|uniref:ABC transporter permease n=1 Tax=Rhodoplanes azumiensis TaxID=1897628 RepID=A0ABW5AQH2_9BRAD